MFCRNLSRCPVKTGFRLRLDCVSGRVYRVTVSVEHEQHSPRWSRNSDGSLQTDLHGFSSHYLADMQPASKHCVGRDSSIGIATVYGLDGPGIDSQWRQSFPPPPPFPRTNGPGTNPASCAMGTGSLSLGQSGRSVALNPSI